MCDYFLTLAKSGGQNCKTRKSRPETRCCNQYTRATWHNSTTITIPCSWPEYEATAVSNDLSCPICSAVLEWHLQLACGNIICYSCCYRWTTATLSGPISSPCCYNHQLDSITIHPPPTMVTDLLSGLLVTYSKECGRSTPNTWRAMAWGTTTSKWILHQEWPFEMFCQSQLNHLQHQQRWQKICYSVTSKASDVSSLDSWSG